MIDPVPTDPRETDAAHHCTHGYLVRRAARWVAQHKRCGIVTRELAAGGANCIPDVIGWRCGAKVSVLVECKTSVSDFRADLKKFHHQNTEYCMGTFRYYFTPAGLLSPELLPTGWGLVEDGKRCRVVVESERHIPNLREELAVLYSCGLRQWGGPRVKVFAIPEEVANGK